MIFDIADIDDKVALFNYLIVTLFDVHAPLRTCKISRECKPWVTETIRTLQKLRDQAYNKFKRSGNLLHFDYYKTLRNFTTASLRREKRPYLEYCARRMNTKTLWKEFRAMNIIPNKGNHTLPEHLSHVDEINNFFASSTSDSSTPDPEIVSFYDQVKASNDVGNGRFNFSPVVENDVFSIVLSISSNSVGCDEISNEFIRLCCPHILPFIVHIFNSCIATNYFPSVWKKSRIIPVPKKRCPENMQDLRPISILCVLSKIFEKLLEKQIRNFADSFKILPGKQSGFRASYSCASALACVTDDIFSATDAGKLTCLILLDFSRAFDTVNHKLLLIILQSLGFSSSATSLIKS